jgi:hypothetical protein
MPKRFIFLILAFVIAATLIDCQTTQILSVCDIVRKPEQWEGKVVSIKAAYDLGREPLAVQAYLTPIPPETCSYPTSKYVSSDEPPEIFLEYPDGHFLDAPPSGYRFREATLAKAWGELERLKKRNPRIQYAKITVDGFIALRKYNLREAQKDPIQPTHTFPPVILTIQSVLKVEMP